MNGFFGAVDLVLSGWHKECDNYVAVTTPTLQSLASTVNSNKEEYCYSLLGVGSFVASSVYACNTSYLQPSPVPNGRSKFSSCICAEPLLSAASVDQYDFNKTCASQPAAYSNIGLWQLCPASICRVFKALTR